MDEYVSKQEVIGRILESIAYHETLQTGLERAISYIRATPPADVRPVVRGRWVINNGRWCCDKCTCQAVGIRSPFCSNCGADMREEINGTDDHDPG